MASDTNVCSDTNEMTNMTHWDTAVKKIKYIYIHEMYFHLILKINLSVEVVSARENGHQKELTLKFHDSILDF